MSDLTEFRKAKDEFFAKCATVNKWVFEIVEKYNGSISAEHGVVPRCGRGLLALRDP